MCYWHGIFFLNEVIHFQGYSICWISKNDYDALALVNWHKLTDIFIWSGLRRYFNRTGEESRTAVLVVMNVHYNSAEYYGSQTIQDVKVCSVQMQDQVRNKLYKSTSNPQRIWLNLRQFFNYKEWIWREFWAGVIVNIDCLNKD